MTNKEYMKKVYRHFSDFVAMAASRELEILIYDAKFTSSFSYKLKQIINEIRESGRKSAEFSVLFNTDGEIAVIDADIVGRFVGDRYNVVMEEYYKNASLNKIIKSVVNGKEKVQEDFIALSYKILYDTINELYMEIKCKKEVINSYKDRYDLMGYNYSDISAVIGALLILEDICKYIGIEEQKILELAENILNKKTSQE